MALMHLILTLGKAWRIEGDRGGEKGSEPRREVRKGQSADKKQTSWAGML